MRKLGIYIHVPFCARSCDFCNFYQEAPDKSAINAYLDAIEKEIEKWPPNRPAGTVFIGGGTPGLLRADDFERLGRAVLKANSGIAPKEWSVEMAPATVKKDKLGMMHGLGINRISMGVQSFNSELLQALGRNHSTEQVYRAIDLIGESGISNLNLDLIFAVPGQSLSMWEADVIEAARMKPQHISTYCLTFEEDTALWLRLSKGQISKHTEVEESEFYEKTWQLLPGLGYSQYEVSNFATPGYACQHNIDTWSMEEWIGYGPSASSQFNGRRYTRAHSLEEWMAGVDSGISRNIENIAVSENELAVDALIFGLRMNRGIHFPSWESRFCEHYPKGLDAFLASLISEELLFSEHDQIFLTNKGRLLADRIGSELLELL